MYCLKETTKRLKITIQILPGEIWFGNINQTEFKREKLIEARTGLYKTLKNKEVRAMMHLHSPNKRSLKD